MRSAALVLVVPLVLFVGWRKWEGARAVRPLNAIATEIAGHHVTVHCPGLLDSKEDDNDGIAGEVGFAQDGWVDDHTRLRGWVCDALVHFKTRNLALSCVDTDTECGEDETKTVLAVGTLTHESFHLRGVLNESLTDCYARQRMAETAIELGATPARADAMARYYLKHLQPLKPAEYQLPATCIDGGALDTHPHQRGWPNPPHA